jgi:hypothetical protein
MSSSVQNRSRSESFLTLPSDASLQGLPRTSAHTRHFHATCQRPLPSASSPTHSAAFPLSASIAGEPAILLTNCPESNAGCNSANGVQLSATDPARPQFRAERTVLWTCTDGCRTRNSRGRTDPAPCRAAPNL